MFAQFFNASKKTIKIEPVESDDLQCDQAPARQETEAKDMKTGCQVFRPPGRPPSGSPRPHVIDPKINPLEESELSPPHKTVDGGGLRTVC
jgi:hypothetical protein